jgi:peptide/nickel transport system permease protein
MSDARVAEARPVAEPTSETIGPVLNNPRRGRVARRLLRNPAAVAGGSFIILLIVVALCAPLLAPHDPNRQDLLQRLQSPSSDHWLGTDEFGRDQLSRLIFGARVSLVAAVEAVAVAAAGGFPIGMLAGFAGGKLDTGLGRLNDALMSVPALLLSLAMISVIGPGLHTAMLAIGIVFIPRFFRMARAATQNVRADTFIEASRALGCTTRRTVLHHVVPNVLTPLVVTVAIAAGAAVTAEASLSFLGLGVKPPTASWGSMLASASSNMVIAPWLVYAPGVAIALTVLSFALFGDGVAGALGTSREAVSEGV